MSVYHKELPVLVISPCFAWYAFLVHVGFDAMYPSFFTDALLFPGTIGKRNFRIGSVPKSTGPRKQTRMRMRTRTNSIPRMTLY